MLNSFTLPDEVKLCKSKSDKIVFFDRYGSRIWADKEQLVSLPFKMNDYQYNEPETLEIKSNYLNVKFIQNEALYIKVNNRFFLIGEEFFISWGCISTKDYLMIRATYRLLNNKVNDFRTKFYWKKTNEKNYNI